MSAPPGGRAPGPGLWRWTAPHPDWRPAAPGSSGDWDRDVGCVAHAAPGAFVFVDPLVTDDAFWRWADAAVAGRPVHVHTTIRWHRRSRDAVVARYGATRSGARGDDPPPGARRVPVRGHGETPLWLEAPRALVCGDALIGDGRGGLRLCPASWLERDRTVDGLRDALRAATAGLEPAIVLPAHGDPVPDDAAGALRRALA
ncbi:MAG: hypothetical protein IRZ32_02880 [Solirubrobacteraceae bacterium]|nr:hypothetical protein [Solirubrobacteraceae bacterium]